MSQDAPELPKRPSILLGMMRRLVTFLGVLVVVLVFVAVFGTLYMRGKPVTAPDWLRDRIEARIALELPQAKVRFGEMVFVVDEGWTPRVRLRDVTVDTAAGAEVVHFNEFKAAFALRPLLEGVVQPSDVALSGIFATLRRDGAGGFALSAGTTASAPARRAANLPGLIGQMDDILQTPSLSALRSIDVRAITLRYVDARVNRAWTVDGGRMRLLRDGDDLTIAADLAVLSGGTDVATLAANYASRIGETAADFGVQIDGVDAQDVAAQSPAFAWLGVLRAPISGAVRSGLNASGGFEPINATLQIGAGVVQPNAATQAIPFEGARSYFSYDPAQQLIRFDELSVQSQWVSGLASGTASLEGVGEGGAFSDLVGQFALRDLRANPQDLYPQAVALDEADVDFQLSLNPFRVKVGRLQISDQGGTLLVNGDLQADAGGWRVALDGRMDRIAPERLLELWPEGIKLRTRKWLKANLLQAQMHNIDVVLRRAPDSAPRTYVAFDYADATVRFLRSMPPVSDGRGHFSLTDDRLVIALDDGVVKAAQGGPVAVGGSSFIIPDVRVKGGTPSIVRLKTRSSVTAALSLINQQPLRVMDRVGLPITLADGQAVLNGTLAVPLKRGGSTADVDYHFAGTLLDLRSDTLVKGRSLRAERLALTVDNKGVSIKGPGRVDGVAVQALWRQPIGRGSDKSTLRGTVALDQKALDTFGIALPKGMVRGAGTAELALDFARGAAPAFALSSDLRGLRLSVPQVGWSKPAGASGSLEIAGQLGGVPKVDKLAVSGPGLSAEGGVTLTDKGALQRLRFDRLRVGNWLDIPVDLIGQGTGRALKVVLRGGSLDLRRAEFGSGGGGGSEGAASGPPGPPMEVNLDRLQITDTISLVGLSGRFGTAKGLDGSFVAALNGGARVEGRVVPQNGRSAVRLTSQDAGGVLRSAGLLKQIVGGNLSLTLLPVGSGGAFDGRLKATGVRVKDAPGIAALLNAVSVVGLVNELNGDGIYFEEVEGDFRMTPNRVTLTKGSAVGASMGISMDGIYALADGNIDMQGVITPVYLLNGIGSVLTRKGEGLIGFNYTLNGPAAKPKVSVNPLSALAPGMFREIFRKPAPEVPVVDGVASSTLPDAAPTPAKEVEEQYEGR